MNNLLPNLLPKNKKDAFLYYLIVVAVLPFIYLLLGQRIDIMLINVFCLLIFVIISIFSFIKIIRAKRKITKIKSSSMWFLLIMFSWIFISGFFAFNKSATWLGFYNNAHKEDSVWQYVFYCVAAICAINLKKENIKYLLSVMMTIACLLILIQFAYGDYSIGFVHRNHSGYYLCMTLMVSIGMFFCQKNALSCILCMGSTLLHFISLILNGSMGPILAIFVFFTVGIIYFIIHKRECFVKFLGVLTCFIVVMTFCDYVPKVRDFRKEEYTTVEKVIDIGIVALNRMGIISNEEMNNIDVAPGSGGYGRLFMWKRALGNMVERPLFGTGVGSWKSYNPDMPSIKPHNEFLQYGATAGWVTMFSYMALLLALFIKYRKNHKQQSHESFIVMGAIFVYVVQSFFGCVMPFSAPTFFILIGLAIKEIDFKNKEEINEKNS